MKRLLRRTGDFLLSLLIHLILDPWELLPAGILLALHFLLDLWECTTIDKPLGTLVFHLR